MDFNPEKYGMTFCPSCSGKGYSYESQGGRDVCRICRGFGLIKKENVGKANSESDFENGPKITFSPLRSEL